MSFATLMQLRYVALILTRADMAASPRYVVENGIYASRALFADSGYSCDILHQNSISEEELNLRTLLFQMSLMYCRLSCSLSFILAIKDW